jgi:hypothetical protein
MEGFVYILCAMAAMACSALLLRRYFRIHTRLLLWCGLFFAALALENATLFIDIVLVPDTDLSLIRRVIPLVGVSLLLYGLIFDVD